MGSFILYITKFCSIIQIHFYLKNTYLPPKHCHKTVLFDPRVSKLQTNRQVHVKLVFPERSISAPVTTLYREDSLISVNNLGTRGSQLVQFNS